LLAASISVAAIMPQAVRSGKPRASPAYFPLNGMNISTFNLRPFKPAVPCLEHGLKFHDPARIAFKG
jgi:hypothetical protein